MLSPNSFTSVSPGIASEAWIIFKSKMPGVKFEQFIDTLNDAANSDNLPDSGMAILAILIYNRIAMNLPDGFYLGECSCGCKTPLPEYQKITDYFTSRIKIIYKMRGNLIMITAYLAQH